MGNIDTNVIEREVKFIYDCLACGQFTAKDIAKGSKLKVSTVYAYLSEPKKIYKAAPEILQEFYKYFNSFNFDKDRVKDIRRTTRYIQI